jgi:hypothetical protein
VEIRPVTARIDHRCGVHWQKLFKRLVTRELVLFMKVSPVLSSSVPQVLHVLRLEEQLNLHKIAVVDWLECTREPGTMR